MREGTLLLKSTIEMNMSTGVSITVTYIMKTTHTVIHEMADGMNGYGSMDAQNVGNFPFHSFD